jgi:hypothetical protein
MGSRLTGNRDETKVTEEEESPPAQDSHTSSLKPYQIELVLWYVYTVPLWRG